VSDIGCVIGFLLVFVVLPLAGVSVAFARGQKRTREEQQRLQTQEHQRGERITQLLEAAGAGDVSHATQSELYELIQRGPVGHTESLVVSGGWFDRVSFILRRLLRTGSGAKVVSLYFECFVFPAGQQAKALEFLYSVLVEAGEDRERLDAFRRLSAPILSRSSQAEANWMYARTLDLVESRHGTPASKGLALHIGRISYSSGRPDRTPTLYDEQAIANDIASRMPSGGE
jgi:hypothetical protein